MYFLKIVDYSASQAVGFCEIWRYCLHDFRHLCKLGHCPKSVLGTLYPLLVYAGGKGFNLFWNVGSFYGTHVFWFNQRQ